MPDEPAVPDHIVKQLYQVPPDRFVAERTRLVKEAKDSGDKDAAAIGRLRRPAASAWALSRLAADDPDAVDELLSANEHLRSAMAGGGQGGGERFRQASDERLRVVSRLTGRAGAILEGADIRAGRSLLERIEATLMATATDEAGAALLKRGVLDQDLAGGGFADLLGLAETSAPEGSTGKGRREGDADTEAARKRRDRLEREARERQDEARAAEDAAAVAERDAEVAERAADAAVKAASVKRKDADRLAREAERARERARSAEDRLKTSR